MATASAPATPEPDAVEELFALMQGSFDSKAQAERDSAFYAISLHMHQVWPERGHFLYVEQALASCNPTSGAGDEVDASFPPFFVRRPSRR